MRLFRVDISLIRKRILSSIIKEQEVGITKDDISL